MTNYRQLKYFIELAEVLHYGKAAESVFITQPSLSRQIASLEEDIGCSLFKRHSRSVALTPAGKAFLAYAIEIVATTDEAVYKARAIAHGEQGSLSIAFSSFFTWNLLPPAIKQYSEKYPDVELVLNELSPIDLIQTVQKGESDLSLLLKVPATTQMNYRPFYSEKLCVVLPAAHPASLQSEPDLKSLKDEPFIASPREITPVLFDAVNLCCKQNGFEPKIRIKTHLQQTIVNFVAAGLGVAIVPVSMKQTRATGVVFREIANSPEIEFGVSWQNSNENPCLPGMLDLLAMLSHQS